MRKEWAIAAMTMVLGAARPALAQAGDPAALQSQPARIDPAVVNALATAIRSNLVALPATATQTDAEAAIVFAIDQSAQPAPVVLAGINAVNRAGLSPVSVLALNAIKATRARVAQRGTGSIAGGPTIDVAFGPGLTATGGSSDYVR